MASIGYTSRAAAGTKRQLMERQAWRARFGRARAPFHAQTSQGPLPGFVVRAILDFGDAMELESGRLAYRLSPPAARAALGAWADRAARLCVIWDPEEDQLVDVVGDAPTFEYVVDEDELWREAKHRAESLFAHAA